MKKQSQAGETLWPSINIDRLWRLFVAIHKWWWDPHACRVGDMASRWREFIQVKVCQNLSYFEKYQNACEIFDELEDIYGHAMFEFLFFKGQFHRLTEKPAANFKRFVVAAIDRLWRLRSRVA